jgi:carbonic anhydrase
MALKGQSIRNGVTITQDGKKVEKQVIIEESVNWVESQENFFKKMLKQGGKCKINGHLYEISLKEKADIDSKGNRPINLPPVPGERTF